TVTFGAQNPSANAAGWNNSDVSMSFTTADNLSGVISSSVSSPLSFTAEGTNLKGTVVVTDAAGNMATFTSPAVNLDKTAPTVLFGTPSPTANAAGWNKTDVIISFTTADNLSGVASTSASSPLSFTTEGQNLKGTVTVTDAADTAATFTTPTVNLDTTAPTVQSRTPTPAAYPA